MADAGEGVLLWCYRSLLAAYGPQGWWPGEGALEVMVGAVLVQNTAWRNVERALANLRTAGVLTPAGLRALSREELEQLLRPAGTYRVKAGRLQALVEHIWRVHGGDPGGVVRGELGGLRQELLAVPGIGPETADSILLYAGGRPIFVVGAYTRRLVARLGLAPSTYSYEQLQAFMMQRLPADAALFNEYHALIVRHGKERCRARDPRCAGCPLARACAAAISA